MATALNPTFRPFATQTPNSHTLAYSWPSWWCHCAHVTFTGFSKVTKRLLKMQETLPWFGNDLRVGLGSVATVLLTGLLVWVYLRKQQPPLYR